MDILNKLERILGETTEHQYAVSTTRRIISDAANEIRRVRAINGNLVRQLNGEPPEPQAAEP